MGFSCPNGGLDSKPPGASGKAPSPLIRDRRQLLRDLFKFLGVDQTFVPNVSERYNPSGVPRTKALQSFLSSPSPIKTALKAVVPSGLLKPTGRRIRIHNLVKPPLSREVRMQLIDVYRDDILKLQNLIHRDLSVDKLRQLCRCLRQYAGGIPDGQRQQNGR